MRRAPNLYWSWINLEEVGDTGAVRPESARMAEIYRFSGLELDTARFQVRRARARCWPVQPQVFDVLHYLVAHHDRIVSKDELFDKVWSGRVVSKPRSAAASRRCAS